MIEPLKLEVNTLSSYIAEELKARLQVHDRVSLAIPGGRSPGPLLESLSRHCEKEVSEKLYLYWVDERCVERGHSDRNDDATLGFWLNGGNAPAHVRSMPAENEDSESASEIYTQIILEDGFKSGMDVSILGIGEDGHFASLFPNHPALKETHTTFSISDSPKPPPKRLSLSLPYILSSKKVIVLVTGTSKGEVLKKAVKKPGEQYPVSLLFAHKHVSYHLDEAALQAYKA